MPRSEEFHFGDSLDKELLFLVAELMMHLLSRSGRVAYSTVRVAQMVVGLSPEPPPMPVDTSAVMWIKKGLAAMLTSIQSAGVAPR